MELRPSVRAAADESAVATDRVTFTDAPVGIAHVAADGSWLRVNRRLCDLLGYPEEELRRLTFQEVTHPEDLAADLAQAERLAAGEIDRYAIEKRYIRKDGTVLWAHLTGCAVRDADGALRHFIAVVEDIEGRKAAERETEMARSLLEAVLAAAPVGFALLDPSLRFVTVNQRLADLNGLPVEEHLGRTPMELLPELPASAYEAKWQEVLRTRQPVLGVDIEGATPARPGMPRSFREDWYPVIVEGEVVALAALVIETTEERRRAIDRERLAAAEAAAAERAQAARVLSATGDGVISVDAAGIVEFTNPSSLRLLHVSGEIIGTPVSGLFRSWDLIADRIPVADEGSSPAPTTLPFEVEGRELWLSISGVRFGNSTVYAFRDETDQRLLEEMRRDITITIAHEIRTPLAAVSGAIATLRRRDVEFGPDVQLPLLDLAAEQAERLTRLADRILLTAEIDSDSVAFKQEPIDPRMLIRRLSLTAAAAAPAGLRVQIGELTANEIAVDARYLEASIMCLLDNALKYTPADGGLVTLSAADTAEGICITVCDTGIGIEPRDQPHVFDKFFRADPEQTHGIGGTGLGLYIARELIERMGGEITLESTIGQGSAFTVFVPSR